MQFDFGKECRFLGSYEKKGQFWDLFSGTCIKNLSNKKQMKKRNSERKKEK